MGGGGGKLNGIYSPKTEAKNDSELRKTQTVSN